MLSLQKLTKNFAIMSLHTLPKNIICGLGMSYADFDHQLIWTNFSHQLQTLFDDKYIIIQEPETRTAKSYRLPDISILLDLVTKKTLLCIEISSEKNLKHAKKQQKEILSKNPSVECFIFDYDNNKWYKRQNNRYIFNSASNLLNYDLNNLYLNSKYKNYIDNHIEGYKNDKTTDKNNLAGLF